MDADCLPKEILQVVLWNLLACTRPVDRVLLTVSHTSQSALSSTLQFPIAHNIAIMAHREHDRPDPALIIKGPRRTLPSKRVQGFDYPITPLEEIRMREKSKLISP